MTLNSHSVSRRAWLATVALGLVVAGWTIVRAGQGAASPNLDPATAGADSFFGLDRLHSVHLTFTADNFDKLPPPSGRGGRGFQFGDADAGYPKVAATLALGEQAWGTVTVRYKGNSSYRSAPSDLKRSLKIEFDKPDKDRTFFGLTTLNLNNNAMDPSQMREALGFDVFRRAGVPAPRTAFVRVYITVPGRFDHEYAGLFTAVEQVDQRFFRDRWGDRVGVLVKPERLRGLFDYGDDWSAYETPYSSKIDAKPADAQRFIAFVRFLNKATPEEFATQLDNYLDVEGFLRFLAAEVVLVNVDSPLGMNHNYWLTVHPTTHKVVWLPWDLNMAFGGFMSGNADLSLMQPAGRGMFPLAERMLATPAYAERYRAIVKEMVATHASLERLSGVMTDAAALIRPAVLADPTSTASRFEANFSQAASASADPSSDGSGGFGRGRRGPALRPFLVERLASIAGQLDGTRPGTPGRGGRGGFGGGFGGVP